MKIIAQIISYTALAATVLPSFVYIAGGIEHDTVKTWMFAATLAWFVVTPFWMDRKNAA